MSVRTVVPGSVAPVPARPLKVHREGALPDRLPVHGDAGEGGAPGGLPGGGEDPPASSPPSLVASFRGVDDDLTQIPPDPSGAVGPNHVVTLTNSAFKISSRTGATVTSVSLHTFWSDPGASGPRVQYDPYAGRFVHVASATVEPGSPATTPSLLVAASSTSDPVAAWAQYRFQADPTGTLRCHLPSLAFHPTWVAVTCNMHNVASGAFSHSRIYVFDKTALYTSAPTPSATGIDLPAASGASLAPAATYDPAASLLHLIQSWNGDSSGTGFIRLYDVSGPIGSEVLTVGPLIGVPAPWNQGGALGDFAPQQGDGRRINLVDDRMEAVFRGGSLWAAHTVFLPSVSPTRAAIQWWEIDATLSTLKQRGRLEDTVSGKHYGIPSLAVNASKDVMIGYSSFSATQFASAGFAVRYSSDPANTLRVDTLLKGGEAPYFKTNGGTSNRWGDHSATVVDPLDDRDFWTLQQFAWTPAGPTLGCDSALTRCDRWSTWWGRVTPNSAMAIVTPSPASVSFPPQRAFTQSPPQTVTIQNTGTEGAILGTLSVVGANPGDFPFATNACNGASLAPGASCSLSLRFVPGTSGARSASIRIPSSAPEQPTFVPLSGTGIYPVVSITPSPLAFGAQRVGVASAPHLLTLSNTGTDTLAITTTVISGGHASNFAITSNACSGQVIDPGSSCQMELTFTPSALGTRSGTLTINHNGSGAKNTVALTGTGNAPNVSLSPSLIDYGQIITGTTHDRSVTLTNTGTAPLIISTLSLAGPDAADFSLPADACSGSTVAPAATCAFEVRFSPVADGAKSATVQIASDAPASPSTLPLSGLAGPAAPAVGLSPPAIAFGDQEVTVTSSQHALTITNTGTATLNLGTLSLTGPDAADFAVGGPCSGASLAPGANCTAQLTFTPPALGARSASLSIPSDASGSPHQVGLTGNGVGSGAISVSPASLGFASQLVGTTSTQRSLTVTNSGSGTLTIDAVLLAGAHTADYAIAVDGCTSAVLTTGQSCQLMLTFTPSALGARTASLTFDSSAATEPVVPITGTGIQPKLGVNPASFDFGLSGIGSPSPIRTLTVTNIGTGALGPITPSFTGANASDFAITSNSCTASYGASQSCNIGLRATPSGDGERTGTLVLTSNDPLGPKHVPLIVRGDGVPPVSAFTTPNNAVLVASFQQITGTVSDAAAGVKEVAVTYRWMANALPTTVKGSLECNSGNLECTWRIAAPIVPGIYTVNARGVDFAGNQESPGPEITVFVV